MTIGWWHNLTSEEDRVLRVILGLLRGPTHAVYELRVNQERRGLCELFRVLRQDIRDPRLMDDLSPTRPV